MDNAPVQPSIVHGIPLAEEPGLGALSIPGYLREVTTRYAGNEALVMHTARGVERWSYAQLWERSMGVARALAACGVGKDARVGVLMTNRPEYLSALFGISLAGGVTVALSTFSTPAELEYLLSASGVSVLLFEGRVLKRDFGAMLAELEPALREAAPGALQSGKFPYLRHLVKLEPVTEGEGGGADAPAFEPWADFLGRGLKIPVSIIEARADAASPSDLGGLFFSSGTTSLPKGILHAQRAFVVQWWRWPRVMGVQGAARSWTGNGFFWSGNVTMILGVALSTGGAVVLQPYFEPEAALKLIQAERISYMSGRPHQWARLQAAAGWSAADLSSLRYVTNSDILKTHPSFQSDWRLPLSYGATETMTITTSAADDPSGERPTGSFGPPLPGNILKIVDPETGAVLPRGQRGELCIKGPTLMNGYLGKAGEDCFDREGYFATGDGGYVDELGRLYWEGRLTEIIKTGGANVSPLEIDAVLANCPGVRRAQTVGVPHDTLGEMVVSCVIVQDGAALDEAGVRGFLREKLASYKVPRKVLFLREDEFPVTANGKVKSGELRQLAGLRLGIAPPAPPPVE
jgi:acyl-CoA synthetase (AMP-forming)/AMP-acid ligase II